MRAAVLAHGIGGRSDLPIPFGLALGASAFVLVVSFVLLAVLWRTAAPGARRGRLGHPRWCRPRPGLRRLAVGRPAGRARVLPVRRHGGVLREERRAQPDGRCRVRAVLGRHRRVRVGAARPGVALAEPGADAVPGRLRAAAARPARGPAAVPDGARQLAGGGRAAGVRVARAGRPAARHPARAELLVRRLLPRDADRRCRLRDRLVRPRGRLPGGLAAVRPPVGARAPAARPALGAAQPAGRRRLDARAAWPAP